MIKRRLPKGNLKFPDPRHTYDKNGKDDIARYVAAFDRANNFVPGGTFVKGKRV